MRQVLDFFDLLTPDDQEKDALLWNLKVASTELPLTVTGEAVSFQFQLYVTMIARVQKRMISEQLKDITSGKSAKARG